MPRTQMSGVRIFPESTAVANFAQNAMPGYSGVDAPSSAVPKGLWK